jgi:hypothetical protein
MPSSTATASSSKLPKSTSGASSSSLDQKSKKRKLSKQTQAGPAAQSQSQSQSQTQAADIDSIFANPSKVASGSSSGSSGSTIVQKSKSAKAAGKERAESDLTSKAVDVTDGDLNRKNKKKKKAKQPAVFDSTETTDEVVVPEKAASTVIEVVDTSSAKLAPKIEVASKAVTSTSGKKRGRKEVEEDKLFRDSRGDVDRELDVGLSRAARSGEVFHDVSRRFTRGFSLHWKNRRGQRTCHFQCSR